MERNSDAIETIETITATETLNQDNIGNEDEAKSHLSNKGNNDGIMVKNNGNLNGLKPKENNKEEFCEVDLDEVSEHSLNVWFLVVSCYFSKSMLFSLLLNNLCIRLG